MIVGESRNGIGLATERVLAGHHGIDDGPVIVDELGGNNVVAVVPAHADPERDCDSEVSVVDAAVAADHFEEISGAKRWNGGWGGHRGIKRGQGLNEIQGYMSCKVARLHG